MYIYSDTPAELLMAETTADNGVILDAEGRRIDCPLLKRVPLAEGNRLLFDAAKLRPWSPDSPVLYSFEANGERVRFGHCTLRPFQNKEVLLNGSPIFLRGYIRGIVAHDHPNMTGGDLSLAAQKNIHQAKKFGFNLVRFHSTVPEPEFVEAADEAGLFIHIEIGFAYDYDENGVKKNLSMNNTAWHDTIVRYRNHPSLAIFCIGNEMHNSGHYPQVRKMYEEGRALAPNKLIMDNSGWGEYDRDTADIYSQHIAYFFPFKHHRDMFVSDNPWRINGTVNDQPLKASAETPCCHAEVRRTATPIRPVLSHESAHYIDVPDYDALNTKFDLFAKRVGQPYLDKYGIVKPRYMTELPALIRRKGLTDKMPDYIAGSRQFKMFCLKTFFERLRFSYLCGFEMLQFADCLKYENKNGIVDCFDDDKYITPDWMLAFNGDLALLADFEPQCYYSGQHAHVRIAVSNYLPHPDVRGDLCITLDGDPLYDGKGFALAGGLQTLTDLDIVAKASRQAVCRLLRAVFTVDNKEYANEWKLWFYPVNKPSALPELDLDNAPLAQWLAGGTPTPGLFLSDKLSPALLEQLDQGNTALLLYEYGAARNTWQMPGALERFKPCIWDRGSNLGGIIRNEKLRAVLASGRYFDANMQPLLEAGTKVNLDHFPCPVEEHVSGIDKPVRDRMKGLIHKIKDFIDDDTLRNFSHLFSLRVGNGLLIVCTFNITDPGNPVVANLLTCLIDTPQAFNTNRSIGADTFQKWLIETNAAGFRKEDVMNHFWEIDNKPVEDSLFWEEAEIDLTTLKEG